MSWRVDHGDCIEQMAELPAISVDAIVTDPPYGLGFMGRAWDTLPPGVPWARECLRVLKPGGMLLAFGGTRTYHRLACAIEDAGFEVRDMVAWLYGSGFPKSLDVSKAIDKAAGAERRVVDYDASKARPNKENYAKVTGAAGIVAAEGVKDNGATITAPATPDAERWQGWGTALKPAHEPICVARKPLVGTVAGNVLAHGTGALNVDGCRIEGAGGTGHWGGSQGTKVRQHGRDGVYAEANDGFETERHDAGRWPANVVLDEEAAAMLDEQTGELLGGERATPRTSVRAAGWGFEDADRPTYADHGGASRFLYVAKASSEERNRGLDGFNEREAHTLDGGEMIAEGRTAVKGKRTARNVHPTVKPVELMRWLVRLVTPPSGTVLDPFTGSGTTGIAALREGFSFIGIEREAEYVAIARARIVGDAPLINSTLEEAA